MSLLISANRAAIHSGSKAQQASRLRSAASKYAPSSGYPLLTAPAPEIFASLTLPKPAASSSSTPSDIASSSSSSSSSSGPSGPPRPYMPTTAECAVHLEFLESLYVLRQQVLKSEELDAVFDIEPVHKYVKRRGINTKLEDKTLWTRRQVKWDRFVEMAVVRFAAWLERLDAILEHSGASRRQDVTEDILPPLDVLMVWHAFLLNPKFLRETCRDTALLSVRFPWRHIHRAVDSNSWAFATSDASSTAFEAATGLHRDLNVYISSWKDLPDTHRKRLLDECKLTLEAITTPRNESPPDLGERDQHFLQRFCILYSEKPASTSTSSLIDINVARKLKDAVLRQVGFIDKMNSRLWIRSPALVGTLDRARARYKNFLKLYKLHPNKMFVPTLDIDIVWHTHQCSPRGYFGATREIAGKFLNHDDSLAKGKLENGFEDTKALYRVHFGQEYSICVCWDCEALQSALDATGEEDAGVQKEEQEEEQEGEQEGRMHGRETVSIKGIGLLEEIELMTKKMKVATDKVAADMALYKTTEIVRRKELSAQLRQKLVEESAPKDSK